MIPVKEEFIEEIIISQQEMNYNDFLRFVNEYNYINKNKDIIKKEANDFYHDYKNKKINKYYRGFCCNFLLLEEKLEEFTK